MEAHADIGQHLGVITASDYAQCILDHRSAGAQLTCGVTNRTARRDDVLHQDDLPPRDVRTLGEHESADIEAIAKIKLPSD